MWQSAVCLLAPEWSSSEFQLVLLCFCAGYRSVTSSSPCSECPSNAAAFFTSIFVLCIFAVVMLFMYYIILRSNRDLMEADKVRVTPCAWW